MRLGWDAMTAAAQHVHRPTKAGPRPINRRRDSAPVAKLIEVCFAGRLDRAGWRVVRQMESLAGAGWLEWALSRLLLPAVVFPLGFVWEEGGEIVGNASIVPVDGHPRRWVLSNVAVHPSYRRRGMARHLVLDCIEDARRRGGREMVLQVDAENAGALALYEELGFQPTATRTTWQRPAGLERPRSAPEERIRPRRPGEWAAQLALARRLYPEGLVFPYPLEEAFFKPSFAAQLMGDPISNHWLWWEDGELVASLTLRQSIEDQELRFILVAEPQAGAQAAENLVRHVLARVSTRQSVSLELRRGWLEDAWRGMGFSVTRVLTWMHLPLRAPARGMDTETR
jgi:ribosomal protein S18 acetylase RimI-like enzyme